MRNLHRKTLPSSSPTKTADEYGTRMTTTFPYKTSKSHKYQTRKNDKYKPKNFLSKKDKGSGGGGGSSSSSSSSSGEDDEEREPKHSDSGSPKNKASSGSPKNKMSKKARKKQDKQQKSKREKEKSEAHQRQIKSLTRKFERAEMMNSKRIADQEAVTRKAMKLVNVLASRMRTETNTVESMEKEISAFKKNESKMSRKMAALSKKESKSRKKAGRLKQRCTQAEDELFESESNNFNFASMWSEKGREDPFVPFTVQCHH